MLAHQSPWGSLSGHYRAIHLDRVLLALNACQIRDRLIQCMFAIICRNYQLLLFMSNQGTWNKKLFL